MSRVAPEKDEEAAHDDGTASDVATGRLVHNRRARLTRAGSRLHPEFTERAVRSHPLAVGGGGAKEVQLPRGYALCADWAFARGLIGGHAWMWYLVGFEI